MHVQPVHALTAGRIADPLEHLEVARLLHHGQRLERRHRMRTGRREHEPVGPRDPVGGCAQHAQRADRLVHGRADAGVQLHDGGVQLGLQRARQREPGSSAEENVDSGRRLERLRVENHQLLLDAERERGRLAEMRLDHLRMPCTGRPAASHA